MLNVDFHELMTRLKAKYGLNLVKGQYSQEDKKPLADNSVKCPKCSSAMVKRKSKYGEFWGCSTYPRCNGIMKCAQKDQITETRFVRTFEKRITSSLY